MAEIYKAVFKCPDLNEKEVWFVGSRNEARRHLNQQTRIHGKLQQRYRDREYTFDVKPVFQSEGDAGFDTSIFGTRT